MNPDAAVDEYEEDHYEHDASQFDDDGFHHLWKQNRSYVCSCVWIIPGLRQDAQYDIVAKVIVE